MEFPKVESTLFERLRRTHKFESDPRVALESERSASSSARDSRDSHGPRTTASPTDSALRYELHSEIGRGGMGAVFKVLDTELHRTLAMKVALCTTQGPQATQYDDGPTLLERFLEEAQVTGQLDHPGIVPLHEVGIDDEGRVYFTMRLVRGKVLSDVFDPARRGEDGWTQERLLVALIRVCEAMAYAHSKGVVHRDLKPANVMVGRFGEVYVMDWGLAKVRGRSGASASRTAHASVSLVRSHRTKNAESTASDAHVTSHGSVFGTPAYMAPEQARSELHRVDERSDIYSLGAILYHMLAGRAPYTRTDTQLSADDIVASVATASPTPLRTLARDVPPELAAITAKAMSREPADRYQDMLALADDLRAFLRGHPVSALPLNAAARAARWVRRNTMVAGALAAITIGAAYAIFRLISVGNEVVRQATIDSTALQARMLEDVNALYSSAVASRVDRTHVQVTHDYAEKAGAIPIPATFLTDLAAKISQHGSGTQMRQYSDYPFRFREPWKMDAFEKNALVTLRNDPTHPVYSFEEVDGRPSLRFAVGRRMEAGCVACHNTHPDSTKTDWKVGEVRGVLEIVRPLDQDVERMKAGLTGTMWYVAGIVGVSLLLSFFFVLRHAMRTKEGRD
jgi:serine/threonine protein kinase